MFRAIGNGIKWIGDHFKGMLFLLILVLVFMLKKDETKHLTGGYEELNSEVSKQLNSGAANRM